MKIAVKGLGIAVLAAMLVFALAGCDEAEDTSTTTSNYGYTPVVTPSGKVVTIDVIKGVIVPAYGLTPVTAITENEQYSGTVTWNGNPYPFAASTVYTATITLTPKTGYTLQGVAADFFKVEGSPSASNSANSGIITAVYPQTDSKRVSNIAIKTQPTKLTYKIGEALDLTGLWVTLTYDDNNSTIKNVNYIDFPSESITTDPADGDKLVYSTHNEQPVKITYGKIKCETNKLDMNTQVTFNSVTANGSVSQSSTQLALNFSQEITNLSASDITISGVSGVTKGYLDRSGATTYYLSIYGFTAGGTLTVTVAKSGYTISGTPKTVTIYYYYYNGISPGTIEMVSIPAGTFMMGSPASEPNRYDNETQHSVTLSAFSMSKYQVTQAQWVAVMGAGEDRTTTSYGKGDNYPIYDVSWYNSIVFCNKLSMIEGLNPVYSINGKTNPADWGAIPTDNYDTTWDAAVMDKNKNGYRLPTEAEWEYACRAGTTTPFNTGNNITTDQANYNGNYPYNGNAKGEYRGKTTPVGSFAPNAWGLFDMHGNLYEWCWDWYGSSYYSSSPAGNPTGPSTGSARVVRGRGWNSSGQVLRSACRFSDYPFSRNFYIGFRLVRS